MPKRRAGLLTVVWVVLTAVVAWPGFGQPSNGRDRNVIVDVSPDAAGKRSLAILIGVQDYAALPALKYCQADVELLAEVLKDHCHFDTVITMTDAVKERRYRPTVGNLSRELRQHLQVANNGEYQRVLLYFSGHGFRDSKGRLYFAPPDCDRKNLLLTALPHAYVKQMLDGCTRVPVKILMLDCCHAGEGKGGSVGADASQMAAVFKTAKGLLTLSSCSADEVSLESKENGHGLFTYWLCEGLKGAADLDDDSLIDIYELHRYVYGKVLQEAVKMGRDQTVVLRPSDDWKGIAVLRNLRPASPRDQWRPVAVVSLSSYRDALRSIDMISQAQLPGDTRAIGSRTEAPAITLEGLSRLREILTAMAELAGVDETRPWGAMLQTDGKRYRNHAFAPMSNLSHLLEFLSIADVTRVDERTSKIPFADQVVYARQEGPWAHVWTGSEELEGVPTIPESTLAALRQQYHLAVALYPQNLLSAERQAIDTSLQEFAQESAQQLPTEADEEYAIRRSMTGEVARNFSALLNEIDTILLGWTLDGRQNRTGCFELTTKAMLGTEFARDWARRASLKSSLGAFDLPNSFVQARWSTALTQSEITDLVSALDRVRSSALDELENQGLNDSEFVAARRVVDDLMDVVEETAQSGDLDGGLAITAGPHGTTFVAGVRVAQISKLEDMFVQLVDMLQEENPSITVKSGEPGTADFTGFRLYTISTAPDDVVPGQDAPAGECWDFSVVAVGFGKRDVYVATGRNAMSTLKQAIKQSEASGTRTEIPLRLTVTLHPLAELLAATGDQSTKRAAREVAAALAASPGKDHIRLALEPIERGVRIRLEFEEGVLNALKTTLR